MQQHHHRPTPPSIFWNHALSKKSHFNQTEEMIQDKTFAIAGTSSPTDICNVRRNEDSRHSPRPLGLRVVMKNSNAFATTDHNNFLVSQVRETPNFHPRIEHVFPYNDDQQEGHYDYRSHNVTSSPPAFLRQKVPPDRFEANVAYRLYDSSLNFPDRSLASVNNHQGENTPGNLFLEDDVSLHNEGGNMLTAKELSSYFFKTLEETAPFKNEDLRRTLETCEPKVPGDLYHHDTKVAYYKIPVTASPFHLWETLDPTDSQFQGGKQSSNQYSLKSENISSTNKEEAPNYLDTSNTFNIPHNDGVLLSTFLQPHDRKLGTDFTLAVVNELEIAYFCERDRKGKRSSFAIDFPGLACRHCKGFSKGRKGGRYFHSSIKTMSDSKKSLLAMFHHLSGCEKCPSEIKILICSLFSDHTKAREVEKRHSTSTQRAFFRRIWAYLHPLKQDIPVAGAPHLNRECIGFR